MAWFAEHWGTPQADAETGLGQHAASEQHRR